MTLFCLTSVCIISFVAMSDWTKCQRMQRLLYSYQMMLIEARSHKGKGCLQWRKASLEHTLHRLAFRFESNWVQIKLPPPAWCNLVDTLSSRVQDWNVTREQRLCKWKGWQLVCSTLKHKKENGEKKTLIWVRYHTASPKTAEAVKTSK